MKKKLLIFGSNGALGKGVTKLLKTKEYDKIFHFDFHPKEDNPEPTSVHIEIDDLSIEDNVIKAFANIQPAKDTVFFLFTTVGGFAGGKKVWDTDLEEWNKMMDMNLTTSFLISKHFALLVKDSHSGSICFTTAAAALSPEIGKSAYGASKSALIHLVKTLSDEGKDINLSVNAIAPYIIDTPANREWMSDADFNSWMQPAEIGELIHSLFSNYNFVTGNIITLKHRFLLL